MDPIYRHVFQVFKQFDVQFKGLANSFAELWL